MLTFLSKIKKVIQFCETFVLNTTTLVTVIVMYNPLKQLGSFSNVPRVSWCSGFVKY